MSFTVKVEPIDRDIDLMLAEELGPQARSQALASFAREQLAEAQAVNAKAVDTVPPHETFVDGRKGAAVESVRPDGTIVFEFEIITDVLAWIGAQLVRHSPVLTGEYARSHILLADGVEIAIPGPIPAAREYVFLNTQPFVRKIEGVGGRKPLSDQAPDGVYEAVAALAHARFGNVAKIYSGFRTLASAGHSPVKPGRERRPSRQQQAADRQPAIIVTT